MGDVAAWAIVLVTFGVLLLTAWAKGQNPGPIERKEDDYSDFE